MTVTNSVTPWTEDLFKKPIVAHLVMTRFIWNPDTHYVFTRAHH